MKAAVCTRYGPPEVVLIRDVPKPAVGPRDLLVRVRTTTVSAGDARIRAADFPRGFSIAKLALGLRGPRNPILGSEFAGEVEAVGEAVTRFKPGDAVFGTASGTHAEYARVPEKNAVVAKPAGMSFEEAAAIPFGGQTALHFLRDLGGVRPGQRVAIVGASGAVGTASVQVAKHFGAHVTGVCSASNAGLVRSLGADAVVDYHAEPFPAPGTRYDLIFDTVGKATFATCKDALAPDGRYLAAVASVPEFAFSGWSRLRGGKRFVTSIASARREDLAFLVSLAERGAFKPVIDGTFPLDRIVEAHRRVDTGRKRGNVVVAPIA